jgi:N-methylhydantoinase B
MSPQAGQESLDPVRLEVFRNAVEAIADEMSAALRRAAYSTNIKTRLDYSCAIFDERGRMVAQAFTQPVHLGTLTHFVPDILGAYGTDRLQSGDAVLCNDGHSGGIHLNDVCLVAPVDDEGRRLGYVATIAHHVDIGGGTPGSIGLFREIFQEGLQIPPTRLVRDGVLDEEILGLISRNVRSPHETAGDFRAQVAGVTIGKRRLRELAGKYGHAYFDDACNSILDYTERLTRASISQFVPIGKYSAQGQLDDDGFTDIPVRVLVDIEVVDGRVIYDLTGCDEQRQASINTSYAMSFSACAYTLRALLGGAEIPMNDGFYRCIDVTTREGTVADARRPAAIGAGADIGARILEVAFRAFGSRLPERVPADSKGTMCNIGFGGLNPRTGDHFAFYEAQAGGFGGRSGMDGIDAIQPHMQNTENSPIEETEANYPVSIVRYELIPDSEGPGQYRGGLGLRRDYTFEGDVEFSVMADRVRFPPQGLAGGGDARPCAFIVNPEGEAHHLPSKFSIQLQTGDVMSVQMAGGGGHGPVEKRNQANVRADLANAIISSERAKAVYGIGDDG